MALQPIDIDTPQPNGKRGDPARIMAQKVNINDAYLEGLANEAKDGAAGAVRKTGDTMTGGLYWKLGTGRVLRVIDDGAGNAHFQSTNNAGTAFAEMNLRGSTVYVVTDSTMRVDCLQMRVQGPNVPAGQYAGYVLGSWNGRPGDNDDRIELQYYRETNDGSSSWSSFNWRYGRVVDNTPQQYIEFHRAGKLTLVANGQSFQFLSNGNATAPGSFVNGGSDPAIKDAESLRPITGATDALLGLNVRIGKYLPQYNADGLDRAFVMADDAMRQHTPQVIIEDVIDGQYAGWATDQLIAYLVAAHQEGCQREDALRLQVDALEGRIAALEAAGAQPKEAA
ncbi:hypothetical protein [Stenotrophomonas maltophilia]|uniref:hypothetical protein n=1 Tax=Stenotrophomonas maltophilia TaxID=40324 RepID=UPI0028E5875D|nr:hypothetical protein [Stenotrophomonas maltophilia]WNV14463.1 hypothetical protein RS400_20285 [Stenotrophomonas maltophilia]